MERLRIGKLEVDPLTFDGAVEAINRLVDRGTGGAVFTPNVDHVVQCEHDARLREAYEAAALSLADGMPLLWAARILGRPLPAKVSGSDLFEPLMQRAAEKGWRVFLLGGCDEETSAQAAAKLKAMGVNVVGRDCSWISDPTNPDVCVALMKQVTEARTDLLVVALGAPKQELLIHHSRNVLRGTVAVGLGATLEFFTGRIKRAPRWMSERGLEWLYRLTREPGRLWRRYLLRDPAFGRIVINQLFASPGPKLPAGGLGGTT